jgi:uncharacterized cofD-like protein
MGDSGITPLRVVCIGGGTGLSVLLHGLKQFARTPVAGAAPRDVHLEITAVVTVSDDGGSSGRLRRDFDMLPPGDIRSCMVALSEDEALLSRLFQYRFQTGHGLKGHSFGNLFLTALTHITGDFPEAVKKSSEVLAIAGRIYPATDAKVVLQATLDDGTLVTGETKISRSRRPIKRIRLHPAGCRPIPDTLNAIEKADLITIGPGSLFTSVIPNLLVTGVPQAIADSRAVKAYFVNLMWQPGETSHFTASDHIAAIHRHARRKILDYALVNTRPIQPALKKRYARQQALPVENDLARIADMGVEVVTGDFLQESNTVRHNPDAIAAAAIRLAIEARKREPRMTA